MEVIGLAYLLTFTAANGAAGAPQDVARQHILSITLWGVILLTAAVIITSLVTTGQAAADSFRFAPETLLLTVLVIGALGGSAAVVSSRSTRVGVQRLVGGSGQYNPDAPMHTAALVIVLTFNAYLLAAFLLQGGRSALSSSFSTQGVPNSALLIQAVIFVGVALWGVGLGTRRSLPQALQRLGLWSPSSGQVLAGAGAGVGLLALALVYGSIWQFLLPPEQIAQQTAAAEALALAFATLPGALLLSASSAISEEILLRGAVQPVFGNMLTSLFFALLHTQHLITPGLLLLFLVSLALGWLRQRYGTTAAVVAHFTYNLLQMLMLLLAVSAGLT